MTTVIEKMFENVGIKGEWRDYRTKNGKIYEGKNPKNRNIRLCKPNFTAEKQLELIKFLLDKYCDIRIRKNLDGAYYITSFNDISCFSEDFEETLASFTNTHLKDSTDQEKEEIRNILNA